MPKPIVWAMLRARRNTQGASATEGWSRVPSELKRLPDSMCQSFSIRKDTRMLTATIDPEETPNPSDQVAGHACRSGQGDASSG